MAHYRVWVKENSETWATFGLVLFSIREAYRFIGFHSSDLLYKSIRITRYSTMVDAHIVEYERPPVYFNCFKIDWRKEGF